MDGLVSQFCAVTGVDDVSHAKNLLEVCAGNLEMAIDMHMESQTAQASTSNPKPEEEVRAPIPQKREQLVDHDSHENYMLLNKRRRTANPNSVFDKFRDFQAEARQQEELLKGAGGSASAATSSHLTKLEDLFRPPLDLIHHGSLTSAQVKGQHENKWILVNIQNTEEFACQVLNRDIWKDASIRTLIAKHFIFWQVYHDSVEGQKYAQFYPIKRWPYIAILHPVTAELKQQWNEVVLTSFLRDLREYMVIYSSPEGQSKTPLDTPEKKSPKKADQILEADEEAQIAAAIQASLNDTNDLLQPNDLQFESDSDADCYSDVIDTDDEKSTASSPKKKHKDPVVNENPVPKPSTSDENKSDNACASLEDYVSEEGNNVSFQFRLPDHTKLQWSTKSQSKVKALLLYTSSIGYDIGTYELIANFPRRIVSDMDPLKTLDEAGFAKQETLYVQKI